MSLIRPGGVTDLEEILAIQAVTPEAAQWDPADYLGYRLAVCVEDNRVAAFAVWRETAPDERELLNLAVLLLFGDAVWERGSWNGCFSPPKQARHILFFWRCASRTPARARSISTWASKKLASGRTTIPFRPIQLLS